MPIQDRRNHHSLNGAWAPRTLAAATAFTSLALAGPAHAQEDNSPSQRARALEEVVVTARRREESAQSVPISVTAFDGSTLENFRIDDLDDLQYFDPSFSVSSASGRPNAPVYSIRGIRPTEAIFGQDPTVAIYFADVVLSPAKASNLGMYDLQSVQVLKGPQGTLFGRNTTGGAILLTPTAPGRELGGRLMVGAGEYGYREAQFGVDLPATPDWRMRVAGRTTDSDGYQENVAPGRFYGDERGGGESYSLRLTSEWEASDAVRNSTILTWDKVALNGRTAVLQGVRPDSPLGLYNGGPPLNLPSIFDALERAQNRDVHDVESDMRELSEAEVWGIINTTTVDLNDDLQFKSILGYRDMDAYEVVDMDATAIPNVLTSMQTTELEHASAEFQLLGTALDQRLDWVAGLYWYHEDGEEDSPGNVLQGINPLNPFMQNALMKNSSYSLFGQGTYHLNDTWSLTGGLRWTYDDKELTVSSSDPSRCVMTGRNGEALTLDNCSVPLSDSFSQPTGSLTLEYQPSDQTMLYAASRLGYRAGGFNARATQPIEYEPFDPETVMDLELGAKTDWQMGDWQMRTNIAVYNQWYDDIQRTVNVLNQVGVPGSVIENAAEATVFGLEIDQTISPSDNLTLRLQYAYTDPEYKEWTDPATGMDLSDTPFYFTPENAFTGTLSYLLPLADAGDLAFSASASYQSEVWISALQTIANIEATPPSVRPALQQESYWLLGLNVDWSDVMGSRFDVSAYVRNLTDEEYAVGGVQLYHSFGLSTKVYGEPRTVGMELRYRF